MDSVLYEPIKDMKSIDLKGICVPLLTPYDDRGNIDYTALEKLMNYVYDNGVTKFFIGGTTGEFINLHIDERKELIKKAVDFSRPDAVIMNNVTATNMKDLSALIDISMDLGVSAVSLTPPFYHAYDEKAIKKFFVTAAQIEPSARIYLYNIPSMAKNSITPEVLFSLRSECPNIVGIKDSSMDFMTLLEYQALMDKDFEILTGNDAQVLTALQASAQGAVIASANVWPKFCAELYEAHQAGDINKARNIQEFILKFRALCREIMPIGTHKEALRLIGINLGKARFPMRELDGTEKAKVYAFLEEANALIS